MDDTTTTDMLNGKHATTDHFDDTFTIKIGEVVSSEQPAEPHISDHPTILLTPPKRYFRLNYWFFVAILFLIILLGEHAGALLTLASKTFFPKTATITIFATQKRMQETYTFLAVTGTADQSQKQIPSRILSFTSPTKTETIKTTGVGYTPAIQATGELTFYNEAPYAQTMSAGTVVTGKDAIQVVTDQTVTIAAGNPPALGSASVAAHTIQTGARANIDPLDMNGLCCLSGIYAKNTTSFIGGVDPQAYPLLSQADVESSAKAIEKNLSGLATTAIHNQVQDSEQFLRPMQCSMHTSSTPNVGQRASTATVSVSETCNAQVYDGTMLQALTRSQFLSDAGKAGSFIPHGKLSIQLANVSLLDSSHNTYQLTVSAQGTLQFHLSPAQLHILSRQIAGKRLTEAQRQLLHLRKKRYSVFLSSPYPSHS